MSTDPRSIHIYTDGSCYKNPGGRSGCAAIVQYPDHLHRDDEQIVDFGCSESSNNRMELLACIRALQWVRNSGPWPQVTRVQLFTDSKYVHDSLYRAAEWKKNHGRNRHGEPKENMDLWKQLLTAQKKTGIPVHFEWTLGKKSPILKSVDKAAKAAAAHPKTDDDHGYRHGTIARSMVKGAAARFPATGQVAAIRPYRKALSVKGEEKIRFDTFSETTGTYLCSFYAFATSELTAELHRGNGYIVRFNDNANYPQIVELIGVIELPKMNKPEKASDKT